MTAIDLDELEDVLKDYILVEDDFKADPDEEWQKLYPIFAAATAYHRLMTAVKLDDAKEAYEFIKDINFRRFIGFDMNGNEILNEDPVGDTVRTVLKLLAGGDIE